jgi:hypothetical protein
MISFRPMEMLYSNRTVWEVPLMVHKGPLSLKDFLHSNKAWLKD